MPSFMTPPAGVTRAYGVNGKQFTVRADMNAALVDDDSITTVTAQGWTLTALPATQVVYGSAAPSNNDGRPEGTVYIQTA